MYIQSTCTKHTANRAHLGGFGPGAAVLLLKHDLVLLHIPPDGLGRGTNTRAQHTVSGTLSHIIVRRIYMYIIDMNML